MRSEYLSAVFAGLLILGIAGITTVPESITLQTTTTDGVTIFYNLYVPEGLIEKTPVIIIGHGIMVNKEMMTTFAVEFIAQGYIVATLDWRGHGRSTGELSRKGLYRDLEAVIADIPAHAPADMGRIALLGYSMGGFPTYEYAASHSAVKAWVGVGTVADGSISSEENPHNVLMIIAKYDEAFPPEKAREPMAVLTGISLEDIEFERLYGNLHEGTARKIHVIPWADHLTTPWDSDSVLTAASWIKETFEDSPDLSKVVYYKRAGFLLTGLTGLVGFLFAFSSVLAGKFEIRNGADFDLPEISVKSFIGKYYAVTLSLVFTAVIFLPLFLTPLPFTAFLTALNGGLGITLLIYCWFLAKKGKNSLRMILRENLLQNTKIWIFSLVLTAIFLSCYYFLVGLHFLGMVPSAPRILYLVLYAVILFVVFSFYSLFIQKVSAPFFERKLKIRNSTVRFMAAAFLTFILLYSWFLTVVLIPCIVVNDYFIAMILILMVPIFLFMSFFSFYMEKITGSIIPNAVVQSVWLGFIITTLSPYSASLFIG